MPQEWALIDEPSYRMLPGRFGPRQLNLLRLAADRPEVARIFVNPVIKAEVCKQAPGEAWVGKLRPWVGHFSHFHVRLRCPANSPDCQSQAPIPRQWLWGGAGLLAQGQTPVAQGVDELPRPLLPRRCEG